MWSKHPEFIKARNGLIKELEQASSLSSHKAARSRLFGKAPLPKIVFICGGDPKYCSNRGKIEKYITTHRDDILTFRAEYAWNAINTMHSNVNALELEEWLADFSDVVIILVESFGTVAELGAFSISKPLRKKLLPILDKNFESDESFINTGPVKWVDDDSVFSPSIYADFKVILTAMPDVISKLDYKRSPIYNSRKQESTYGDLRFTKKEFLFMVILIVASIGPIDEDSIVEICKRSFNIEVIRTSSFGHRVK